MKQNVSASTSTISPVPQPDERALVSEQDVLDSIDRLQRTHPPKALPIPRIRRSDFLTCVLVRMTEVAAQGGPPLGLSPSEMVQLMVRRELREWFTLHPRTARVHRRLNTRRWRFARDGQF